MLTKKERLNNRMFLGTKLNWFVHLKSGDDDENALMLEPTPLLAPRTQKYFVSTFQSDYKEANDLVIESKLIIKKADPVANSGKYYCSTQNFNSNNMLNAMNTSSVDIQVVGKNYMSTDNKFPKIDDAGNNNKSAVYCPQFITQTYKGVYSWPKTLARTQSKLGCHIGTDSNAYLTCDASGKWAIDAIELSECEFTSNLTRFLQTLTYVSFDQIVLGSNITLDKLITYLVKSDSFNLNDPLQVTKYDILYVQRFLLANLNSSREAKLGSLSWRRQFVWLNDLLARLSPVELVQARELDANTFNMYFSQCFMPVITADFVNKHQSKKTGSESGK